VQSVRWLANELSKGQMLTISVISPQYFALEVTCRLLSWSVSLTLTNGGTANPLC